MSEIDDRERGVFFNHSIGKRNGVLHDCLPAILFAEIAARFFIVARTVTKVIVTANQIAARGKIFRQRAVSPHVLGKTVQDLYDAAYLALGQEHVRRDLAKTAIGRIGKLRF